jgi:hypothetical protein
MCLNTEFNCLVFVSKFDLKFCRSIGGTTYPINANMANNNLCTDKRPQNITKSHPKICSNKYSHFQAFVSKFYLRFCHSIGGTTYPVNPDVANNNLATDKTPKTSPKVIQKFLKSL